MSNTKTPYYKKIGRRVPKATINRENEVSAPEPTGGFIQGKEATAPEMMWARGLGKTGKYFEFQVEMPTAYSLPGKGKQVDFVVDGIYYDEIDGEFAHKTESQKQLDSVRDTLLSELIHSMGGENIRRIDATRFRDQKFVDDLVREYYL